VYVHTGCAIGVVHETEALESLELLTELAETCAVDELFYSTDGLVPAEAISPSA
jgi:hypothetical protein